jgi:transposase
VILLSDLQASPHQVDLLLRCLDPLPRLFLEGMQNIDRALEFDRIDGTVCVAAMILDHEKPGIQAIGTTAPDLPPVPGAHPTIARDHEYKRHGTVTLMAGIDLLTGQVHALVRDRHRRREFIEFLGLLDMAYPAATAIKIIVDNHSAHISRRETKAWLAARPEGRFQFVFTPKHGSWLNLVEGFFAKAARSVLRHIRVASKHELKQRILEFIDDLNRDPVIHRWHYQIDAAA